MKNYLHLRFNLNKAYNLLYCSPFRITRWSCRPCSHCQLLIYARVEICIKAIIWWVHNVLQEIWVRVVLDMSWPGWVWHFSSILSSIVDFVVSRIVTGEALELSQRNLRRETVIKRPLVDSSASRRVEVEDRELLPMIFRAQEGPAASLNAPHTNVKCLLGIRKTVVASV